MGSDILGVVQVSVVLGDIAGSVHHSVFVFLGFVFDSCTAVINSSKAYKLTRKQLADMSLDGSVTVWLIACCDVLLCSLI